MDFRTACYIIGNLSKASTILPSKLPNLRGASIINNIKKVQATIKKSPILDILQSVIKLYVFWNNLIIYWRLWQLDFCYPWYLGWVATTSLSLIPNERDCLIKWKDKRLSDLTSSSTISALCIEHPLDKISPLNFILWNARCTANILANFMNSPTISLLKLPAQCESCHDLLLKEGLCHLEKNQEMS